MISIAGGERVGNNIFFSLEEFSIPNGEETTFESAIDIVNIFVSVTGNEASVIDGLLDIPGEANLFFINPNGINFQEDTRLDGDGSFIATTANSIDFADGTTIVAGADSPNFALTDSIPVAFDFLGNNGSITVNGSGSQISLTEENQIERNDNTSSSQLVVDSDRTLALIGGEIQIEGGSLVAESGRIELGSVEEGEVTLNSDSEILTLGFEGVSSFDDIELTAKSAIDVSGSRNGSIQVQGDDILLQDGSVIFSQNTGDDSAGTITIDAAQSLTISGVSDAQISSSIVSEASDDGKAGNIVISTGSLELTEGGNINSTSSNGDAGEINIDTSELVIVDDSTISIGTGGNLNVDSSEITIDNAGGSITIDSTDLIIDSGLEFSGETAQVAYIAYYGRPADRGGLDFWQDVLTENEISYSPRTGDYLTGEEQIVYDRFTNQFATSEEIDRLFDTIDNNRDKVNQVYQFVFARDAEAEGSDYWTEQLDNGNINLVNFALEIALGARNADVTTLFNKIESADLFSQSLDTEQEIEAYQGASGENVGRNWLDDFGETISSQAQVDSALIDLVNGDF